MYQTPSPQTSFPYICYLFNYGNSCTSHHLVIGIRMHSTDWKNIKGMIHHRSQLATPNEMTESVSKH